MTKNQHNNSDMAAEALASLATAQKDHDMSALYQRFAAGDVVTGVADIDAPAKPYQQVLWVYKCVNALARTLSGIPLQMSLADDGMAYNARNYTAEIRRLPVRHSSRRLRELGIAGRMPGGQVRAAKGARSVCVGRAADGELVTGGDAVELFACPNSILDSFPKFITSSIGFLFTRGRMAWVLDDMVGLRPRKIHVIDGKHISPVIEYDVRGLPVLLGYKYRSPKHGAEHAFGPEEVKYWSLWTDGDNPLMGMSPTLPGRLAIATDYNSSLFNASALANGCEPGLTITYEGTLTKDQREDFKDSLRQRHGGAARARKPLILEGGGKLDSAATTLKDMEHNLTKQCTRLEICALYDVPPVVAGWVEAAGDSSAYADNAMQQFYQQAIFTLADSLAPAMQEIVSRIDSRLVVSWDLEDQPIVAKMRLARKDAATAYFNMGYPPNRINEVLDLGLGDVDWGDTGFLPMGLSPAAELASGGFRPEEDYPEGPDDGGDDVVDPDIEPPEEQPPEEDQDDAIVNNIDTGARSPSGAHTGMANGLPARTRTAGAGMLDTLLDTKTTVAVWKRWMRSWSPLANSMRQSLRSRYHRQERLLKKALAEVIPNKSPADAKAMAGQVKAGGGIVRRVMLRVFGGAADSRAFRVRCESFVTDANTLGVRQALKEAGLVGAKLDEAVRALLANPRIAAAIKREALVISTRIDLRTRNILRGHLATGLDKGETTRQLADRVQKVMGNRRKSAIVVARNAVGQALSSSRYEGQRAAGMTHKAWMHSRGPGERRPGHVAAERRYFNSPIPMDEMFFVDGEQLLYPRDYRNGTAKNTINCQCLHVARRIAAGKSAAEIRAVFVRHLATLEFESAAALKIGTTKQEQNNDNNEDDKE